jgi:hypothetical protein
VRFFAKKMVQKTANSGEIDFGMKDGRREIGWPKDRHVSPE